MCCEEISGLNCPETVETINSPWKNSMPTHSIGNYFVNSNELIIFSTVGTYVGNFSGSELNEMV
jgi:hypothetical protein